MPKTITFFILTVLLSIIPYSSLLCQSDVLPSSMAFADADREEYIDIEEPGIIFF